MMGLKSNDKNKEKFTVDVNYNFSMYKKSGSGLYDEVLYKNKLESTKLECENYECYEKVASSPGGCGSKAVLLDMKTALLDTEADQKTQEFNEPKT